MSIAEYIEINWKRRSSTLNNFHGVIGFTREIYSLLAYDTLQYGMTVAQRIIAKIAEVVMKI